ncbi:hypothetical protein D9Q98_000444 [Chlorella vulgaris]|uniref:Uncharacterized protein n=1 Tax=Chlorella vulgaris TaxID=3077 RepID=A0A9D4TZA1_CHLVU|nr:hypothetical protein D9Q98_000444 [Chlorella vulgaris]
MLATSASKAGAPVMRHARSTRACQVSRPGIAPRLRQSTPPRHQSCRPTAAASGGSLPQHPAAAPARAEDTAWPAELPLDFERKREGYLVELRRAAAFAALGLGSLCSCVWLLFQALDAVMKGLSWSQAAAAALAPKFERLLSLFVGRAEATAMAPGLAAALTPSILQLFAVIFVLFMLTLYLAINGIVTAELISKHLNFRLLKVTGAHPSSSSAPLNRHLVRFDWSWGDLLALWVCRAVVMTCFSPFLWYVRPGNLVLSAIALGVYAKTVSRIIRG